MISIVPAEAEELRPRISVVGIGGAGANAVAAMIANDVAEVEFIVANTDAQALNGSPAGRRIQLGRRATQGLGAGADPAIGRAAAEESLDALAAALEGVHMCFIAAGMGGGTGTGASSAIAELARSQGILTVGVVTLPFAFEGRRRARAAEAGVLQLEKHVDALIVIPNQNLFRIALPETTFKQAFDLADAVLQQGVRGITDLILTPGLVNLDFADIRAVMEGMGRAMMGTGEAAGPNRAIQAAEMAIFNPLLDGVVKGARGLIISIAGGEDLRLMEIDEAASYIRDMADPEADIIWGSTLDPKIEGTVRISIIATGLDDVTLRSVESPAVEAVTECAPIIVAETAPVAEPAALEHPAEPPQPEVSACRQAPPVSEDARILVPADSEPPVEVARSDELPAPGLSLFERVALLARNVGGAQLVAERPAGARAVTPART